MTEKTRVSRKDTRNGSWNCTVRAKQTYAPTMTSSPWAKFTTLVALKMMTKPRATRL